MKKEMKECKKDEMKATAIAHPMQGLLKYHGLIDKELRIPFHDSISVNIDALYTKTTVEFGDFEQDTIVMNGKKLIEGENAFNRCLTILNKVKELAGITKKFKVSSENSLSYNEAKGLGFSSAGGAALAGAAFKAANLDKKYGWNLKIISRIARRLAGSASRSVAGEYARWYTGKDDGSSYAEKIATKSNLDMGILIVPIPSDIRTEEVHSDIVTSPFFEARIKSVNIRIEEMELAIKTGDLEKVAQLSEIDALELHALTMTGQHGIVIFQPESIQVIAEVKKMRQEGIPVWFSMQTGPSVFINTYPKHIPEVQKKIELLGLKTIRTGIGGEVRIVD
ncbi:MAG: diphosphomevalonate decarboxylase [Methanosarcinales archaeon]|nr:diphosphomevalonate decarboxylase [Methanosarcinales archaeon]